MLYHTIIVKIGGRVLENKEHLESTISQFKYLCKKGIVKKIIIIPGGGSYANFIRKLDKKISIGDDLSHWMAIFAMNCNGNAISQEFKEILCIKDIKRLKESTESMIIFLPFDFLFQTDELPHSWSVTSDSIAIYIASVLKLNHCFLIKDIDGVFIKNQVEPIQEVSVNEYEKLRKDNKLAEFQTQYIGLKKSNPIDLYSIKLINDFKIVCIILNGSFNTNRIFEYFDESKSENKKHYTKIIHNSFINSQ